MDRIKTMQTQDNKPYLLFLDLQSAYDETNQDKLD